MNEAVQDAEAAEPQAQAQAEPADSQQQHAEPEAGAPEGEVAEPEHALEPGGERFKQVWARAKAAEERAKQAEDRVHQIEIERARLEGELKATEEAEKKQRQATEREYSWDELENFIEAGRLTRAQANAYKEQQHKKRLDTLEQTLETKLAQLSVKDKVDSINADLDRYKAALPAMMQAGTPERKRVEGEYRYLVDTLGYPANMATELAAARAAFGPPETVEQAAKTRAATTQQRPSFMDTPMNKRQETTKKDPVQTLDARAKEHYEKLIKRGRYGLFRPSVGITADHWAKVREELTWTRKT